LPKYKDKDGRNILIYDLQALSKPALKRGLVAPSQLGITIQTKVTNVVQVRIVPRGNHYVVEVVYEQAETQQTLIPLSSPLLTSG
jgi:putative transposase